MSSERFAHYWIYIFDLHNLHLTGTLQHTANPTSPFRMDYIVQEMISGMKIAHSAKLNVATEDNVQDPTGDEALVRPVSCKVAGDLVDQGNKGDGNQEAGGAGDVLEKKNYSKKGVVAAPTRKSRRILRE